MNNQDCKSSKIYVVGYYGGVYDSSYEKIIFCTFDKNKAEKYVNKFNKLLDKWTDYYNDYYNNNNIDYYNRCYKYYIITDIMKCKYEEIELR